LAQVLRTTILSVIFQNARKKCEAVTASDVNIIFQAPLA
jgi:hypothetical protein